TAKIAQPILGPRQDPNRLNPAPVVPANLKKLFTVDTFVVLKLKVMEDGTVGEADVAESSGTPALDKFAMDYAKVHWHYLPANNNGRLIEGWLTVSVILKHA